MRPLTVSHGWGRVVRITGSIVIAFWFALPFLPLLLWAFANRWSYPAPVPTIWGFQGAHSAIQLGAIPAFGTSLGLGLSVAAFATPMGALAARAFANGWAPFPRVLTGILFAPVALPPFAAVFGVNVLLLRADVPSLVGVVLVLVVVAIPYTTFSMRVAYASHDIGYEEEARTLGASRRHVLWRVHLPMLAPALARSAFLAFLVGWSDYVVTLLVGGGQIITLPLLTAAAVSGVGNDASTAILSLSAILPPVVLLSILSRTGVLRKGGNS